MSDGDNPPIGLILCGSKGVSDRQTVQKLEISTQYYA